MIGRDCELVDAIVFGMAAVTGDAGVFDLMAMDQFIELLPEIIVLEFDEFVSLSLPAVFFPAGHPFRNSLAHVNAVGEQFDTTGTFQ